MERVRIIEVLKTAPQEQNIVVCGWVRTFRNDRFLAINDGSTVKNLQLVIQREDHEEDVLKQLNTGAAVHAEGVLVESQGAGQTVELRVTALEVLGGADPDEFPIQMKRVALVLKRRLTCTLELTRLVLCSDYAIYFNLQYISSSTRRVLPATYSYHYGVRRRRSR